jgi:multiple sugar transport system ATP-binding protein
MNFWPLTVRTEEGGSLEVQGERLELAGTLPAPLAALANRDLVMGIRPDDIPMRGHGSPSALRARVRAKVDVIEPLGSETLLYWHLAGTTAISRVAPGATIQVDQEIELEFDLSRAHFFDAATGTTLLSWPS